jgi:hypothetical protein
MFKPVLIAIILFFCHVLLAQQHWCGFDDIYKKDTAKRVAFERAMRAGSARKARLTIDNILRVPVVVHVIHNNKSNLVGLGNNISNEQIFSAIKVLNEDFRRKNADTINTPAWARPVAADFYIEFGLASLDPNCNATTGITRHFDPVASFGIDPTSNANLKKIAYWPSDQYLNIWVVALTGDYIGYAQFPSASGLPGLNDNEGSAITDGVVIVPFAFGKLTGLANGPKNPYKYGRTLVHEVGHWLGLLHTFNTDETGCNYTDYCNDTPTQNKSNVGLSKCDTTIVGDCATRLMHMNYMDYTNDICMNLFTNDQRRRVATAVEVSPARANLRFSRGLCGQGKTLEFPYFSNFNYKNTTQDPWLITTSTDSLNYQFGSAGLVINPDKKFRQDSLIITTGVFNFQLDDKKQLLFNIANNNGIVDSVKVYYETSCEGKKVFLEKWIIPANSQQDFFVNLKNIKKSAFINVYVVFYANGNSLNVTQFRSFTESDQLNFSLYPNPSTGIATCDLVFEGKQEIEIEVFNNLGSMVLQTNTTGYSNKYLLDISSLVNGIYFVRTRVKNQLRTEKIIKQ